MERERWRGREGERSGEWPQMKCRGRGQGPKKNGKSEGERKRENARAKDRKKGRMERGP